MIRMQSLYLNKQYFAVTDIVITRDYCTLLYYLYNERILYVFCFFFAGGMQQSEPTRAVYRLSEDGNRWEESHTPLYHPEHVHTHIHSSFTAINIGNGAGPGDGARRGESGRVRVLSSPSFHHPFAAMSDSDSETTCGTSMERFDRDSSSDDDDDNGVILEGGAGMFEHWDLDSESSSSDFF
jgi:hypothetical protein